MNKYLEKIASFEKGAGVLDAVKNVGTRARIAGNQVANALDREESRITEGLFGPRPAEKGWKNRKNHWAIRHSDSLNKMVKGREEHINRLKESLKK